MCLIRAMVHLHPVAESGRSLLDGEISSQEQL
jgi:hypothetical protein